MQPTVDTKQGAMGHSQVSDIAAARARRKITEKVKILGVKVDSLAVDELDATLESFIRCEKRSLILHVNVHCLNLSQRNASLRNALNSASIIFCDGAGVMLGARILGKRIKQRIPVTEYIWHLASFAESQGFTLFILGGNPNIAEEAAARLKQQYARLRLVGTHHGYFDKTPGSFENEKVIKMINATKPDLLIVGFGMPLQESWLMENWERLDVKVALTGGAVIDRVAGRLRRGPRWMTDNGLEWMSRLAIEPRRLWKRYLIGNPVFLLRVLRERFTLRSFTDRGIYFLKSWTEQSCSRSKTRDSIPVSNEPPLPADKELA